MMSECDEYTKTLDLATDQPRSFKAKPFAEWSGYEKSLALQAAEVRRLLIMRGMGGTKIELDATIALMGVDLQWRYERAYLGKRLGVTPEEYVRFGTEALGRKSAQFVRNLVRTVRRAPRFPCSFIPAGYTDAQAEVLRRAIQRPKRAEAERERRRAARELKERIKEMPSRKTALMSLLSLKPKSVSDLMADVRRAQSAAFMARKGDRKPLIGNSLRKAVIETAKALQAEGLCAIEEGEPDQCHNAPLIVRRCA